MRKESKSYSISKKTLAMIEEAKRREYKEYYTTTPSLTKNVRKPCSDSAFLETLLLEALEARGILRT